MKDPKKIQLFCSDATIGLEKTKGGYTLLISESDTREAIGDYVSPLKCRGFWHRTLPIDEAIAFWLRQSPLNNTADYLVRYLALSLVDKILGVWLPNSDGVIRADLIPNPQREGDLLAVMAKESVRWAIGADRPPIQSALGYENRLMLLSEAIDWWVDQAETNDSAFKLVQLLITKHLIYQYFPKMIKML